MTLDDGIAGVEQPEELAADHEGVGEWAAEIPRHGEGHFVAHLGLGGRDGAEEVLVGEGAKDAANHAVLEEDRRVVAADEAGVLNPEAELAGAPGNGFVGVDASARDAGDRLNPVWTDGFDLDIEVERQVEAAVDRGVDKRGFIKSH